jgi:hypothetical protein
MKQFLPVSTGRATASIVSAISPEFHFVTRQRIAIRRGECERCQYEAVFLIGASLVRHFANTDAYSAAALQTLPHGRRSACSLVQSRDREGAVAAEYVGETYEMEYLA